MTETPGKEGASTVGRRDLYLVRAIRGTAGGALAVALATDLGRAYPVWLAGALLGLAVAGAAGWAFAADRLERRVGGRTTFAIGVGTWAAGGLVLWEAVADPWAVAFAGLLGALFVSSTDLGALPVLEQSALAGRTSDAERTDAYVRYNFAGYLGVAAGAIVAAPLTAWGAGWGAGGDVTLLLYGLLGVPALALYLRIAGSAPRGTTTAVPSGISPAHRGAIRRLAALFSVDAFGGGIVANSLVTLWLTDRFGASEAIAGTIIALATLGAAVSLLVAGPLARRIGLVPTMVFTHLPSSVLLVAFAVAPTLALAAGIWISRSLLSQMDVPTRQALVQAIVDPEERTAAAGVTTAARSTTALGGPVTGALLELGGPWLAAPFVLAGGLKIGYDLALYAGFRHLPAAKPAPRAPTP